MPRTTTTPGEQATDVGKCLPAADEDPASQRRLHAEEAATAARTMLPDILRYTAHRGRPTPTDAPTLSVFSDRMAFLTTRMAFLTRGKVSSDGLKPHDDLMARLPVPSPADPLTPGTPLNARRLLTGRWDDCLVSRVLAPRGPTTSPAAPGRHGRDPHARPVGRCLHQVPRAG